MLTILEVLTLSSDYLNKCGVEHPRRQSEELLSESLGMKRLSLYLDYNRPVTDNELEKVRGWLKRRGKREPLQYIMGYVDFAACRINVNPKVLIPRQETEILVDKIGHSLAKENLDGATLWDVCCGSGAIGIALKKRFPRLRVCLSDICNDALSQAKVNAAHNDVEIELFQGDLLEPFKGSKADYVVCNPPYIREDEYAALDDEVRLFEPKNALISGLSGLEFYERLAKELPVHLNSKGKVWFEIGTGQGEQVRGLFADPCWIGSSYEQDWSGHDRFFSLEIE